MVTWGLGLRHPVAIALAGSLLSSAVVLGVPPGSAAPASAAQTPAPNPPIADSCGVDVTLVLDASGSIGSNEVNVRNAAQEFLDALKNTDSSARVTQFATYAEELSARTEVNDASLRPGGALRDALNDYYHPKPPRPSGATIYRYDGSGDPQSARNFREDNGSNQYTNWDQSLGDAASEPGTKPDLVVYVTDGDPTAYDLDQAGDPFDPASGPPPDVAMNTNRSLADQFTMDRAVEAANAVKSASTRMLAIGVGSALNNNQSATRLTKIAGPQVVRNADLAAIDSLNDVDVALVTDFSDLAQFLRQVVLELCSPSLSIRKLAQSPASSAYEPAPGWSMSVTPSVNGGFTWILPDAAAAPTKTATTNANGIAQFQWEPTQPGTESSALVRETLETDYTAGQPGPDNDWSCELKDVNGDVRRVTGELAAGADPEWGFALSPPTLDPGIGEEIVTCTVYNSFDYRPDMALTKVDDPAVVRSDVFGPPDYAAGTGDEVVSTFLVENTGNTTLQLVQGGDSRCTDIQYVSGDTNGNGLLDPDPSRETWTFECSRTGPWSGTSIRNDATVTGVDPRGQFVTRTATATVDVRTPAVDITKTAAPTQVVAGVDSQVQYTYVVTNPGDVPLSGVTVTDAEPGQGQCAPIVGPSGDVGVPGQLEPGETWSYTCTTAVTISEPLVNTATVTGSPEIPGRPAGRPNPPVTDTDSAVVTPVEPGLELTKDTPPDVVYPGTTVRYEYRVLNTGQADLFNPNDPDLTGSRDGWVVDDLGPTGTCAPVTYVSGDSNGDHILNAAANGAGAEEWVYECSTAITGPSRNTAVVVARTAPGPGGTALTRKATDFVDVAIPRIDLQKSAVRPVVLDPGALTPGSTPDGGAIAGPDVPLPAPAVYTYLVSNPGSLPLREVVVTDAYGGQASACPVEAVPPSGPNVGDLNTDGLLDPGEAWQYQCVLSSVPAPGNALTKGDSDTGSVDPTLPAPVTNTAVATGVPEPGPQAIPGLPDLVRSEDRIQQVLVIEPKVDLKKSVSPEVVVPGTEVTYTFAVSNPGDVGLRAPVVVDDACVVTPVGGPTNDGDTNKDGILDKDETWLFTCTDVIDRPTGGQTEVTNTAEAFARGPLGNTYADQDSAVVRVIEPAIRLQKIVNAALVPSGTTVDYEFLVTNAGTSPVAADDVLAQTTLVDVADPGQPACTSPTLIAKEGGNQDDLLDRVPAETWRYSCSATITAPTINVAVVGALGGAQFELQLPVFDVAAAFVQPFNPGIEVAKSASTTELVGQGAVTYTYQVRNTGDVPLSSVAERISDDMCAPVEYVSGDIDGDGLLDTADSIFEDALDETWVFRCTTTISQTTTNTVVVPGTPTDPGGQPLCRAAAAPAGSLRTAALPAECDVRATGTARVTVVRPGRVVVVKQAEPDDGELFPFSFGATGFELASRESRAFEGLAPGSYALTEAPLDGWRLESLTCDDPTGDTSVSRAQARADIVVAAGETVTCTFVNARDVTEPTEVTPPGGTLGGTGAAAIAALLLAGIALLTFGVGTHWASRRAT